MKKKNLFILLMASILLILVGCSSQDNTSSKKVAITSTPTLFFHGGGSSYHAEEHMVDAAKRAGVTKSVIRAEVSKTGKVTLVGTWNKGAKNPICEVNYENNRQLNFNKHGEYATNVVKALQKKYGIKKINMVGHSLGNISIIYYMLQNGDKKHMPQIQKQVDIAGHFAGLTFDGIPKSIKQPKGMKLSSNGKPNKMNPTYKQMTKVRSLYNKKHVKVLNIIGDLGNRSDGRVDNISSLSLQYLIGSGHSTYRVLKVDGRYAQHSKLHENAEVDRALIKFLWNK
ncbi:MAG: alpha/beta hydrolase [Lactobacillus sp.]|uniref:alpha/beta hydrolase n=1 Tax=Lactobacillus sp. TaxID=1591 RepID=UPI0023CD40F6|nr:alpha/beta hydrolase [Lactobacillus sp.]MDE7049716.1 alpha/beta hydrolase [Lactobacillus sp.]